MPSRVIRGEINASRSLSRVSLEADLTFRALLVSVDDYGRCEADPLILKALLFPRRERVTPKQVRRWVEELAAEGCVELYQVGGVEILSLPGWEKHRSNSKRAAEPRFPGPSRAARESPGDPRIPEIPRPSGLVTSDECRVTSDDWDAAPAARAIERPEGVEVSGEARTLTRGFLDSIKAPMPTFKEPSAAAYAGWEVEVDRMLRLDPGRSPAAFVELVKWLFEPDQARASPDAVFWRAHVQSPKALRAKWDRLQAVRARGASNGQGRVRQPGVDRLGAAAERLQERFREHLRDRPP